MGAERAPVHSLAPATHAERRERKSHRPVLPRMVADSSFSYRGEADRGGRRRGSSAPTVASRDGHVSRPQHANSHLVLPTQHTAYRHQYRDPTSVVWPPYWPDGRRSRLVTRCSVCEPAAHCCIPYHSVPVSSVDSAEPGHMTGIAIYNQRWISQFKWVSPCEIC
jgi:hypothetical protein